MPQHNVVCARYVVQATPRYDWFSLAAGKLMRECFSPAAAWRLEAQGAVFPCVTCKLVLHACGVSICVQAGQKQLRWSAHEGVVTAVDWNMVNDLLVSGGEDCSYRVRISVSMLKSGPRGAVHAYSEPSSSDLKYRVLSVLYAWHNHNNEQCHATSADGL